MATLKKAMRDTSSDTLSEDSPIKEKANKEQVLDASGLQISALVSSILLRSGLLDQLWLVRVFVIDPWTVFGRDALNFLVRRLDRPYNIEPITRILRRIIYSYRFRNLLEGIVFPTDENVARTLEALNRVCNFLDMVPVNVIFEGDIWCQ